MCASHPRVFRHVFITRRFKNKIKHPMNPRKAIIFTAKRLYSGKYLWTSRKPVMLKTSHVFIELNRDLV